MKILLTGGSGMVGRNIQDYAQLYRDDEILHPSSHELNLLDFESVKAYLKKHQPDFVIHAAGTVGGIQANINNPIKFLVDNLDMGRNIVMAAKEAGIKKLLNLGSSCMYPRSAPNPLREEQILTNTLEPTNEGYALAKIVTAKLCNYCSQETDGALQYKTLIPCNLYGKYDKFDGVKSHMIPAALYKLHQAKTQSDTDVQIWGDGTARREFMYAEDLADAVFYAIDNFERMPDMLNIGLGHDFSINEYYSAIAKVIGFNGSFVHDITKPVGMKQKLVSTEKLEEFGWTHKYSLEDGLKKTYQYYLESN
ncbi:GDP-L-fucose synthase family protein [Psychrobacter sp. 1U2]|uniref:GDP-L-fucose synthase family protein n=1 Tax=Psychrobacter sp. 1U2 TaxID=3453577 RepID=UPI003F46E66D